MFVMFGVEVIFYIIEVKRQVITNPTLWYKVNFKH